LEAFYAIPGSHRNVAKDYVLSDVERLKGIGKKRAGQTAGRTTSYSLDEFKKILNEKYAYSIHYCG
jgi:hypothetical protein